jgi:integrase
MWVLLYREGDSRRYETLGRCSEMTKSDAESKRDQVMREINARSADRLTEASSFGDFLMGVYLPFYRGKWKYSTRITNEQRMQFHLVLEFGKCEVGQLGLKRLQGFLDQKAASGLSFSIVDHLRWDLRSILGMAHAEGLIDRDPTGALYTPRQAERGVGRVMTRKEVNVHVSVLDFREQVIDRLAIFAGMRPGEILALRRGQVAPDGSSVTVKERLYRGNIDKPKTDRSKRTVALPPTTARALRNWLNLAADTRPDAWVFASENPEKPLWKDNVWYRHMKPKLAKVGLDWANFQVMRRTHASLGHEVGVDPKVSADQRGHGIGVAIEVYTQASLEKRAEAAAKLENAVLIQ